jgi:2-dehydro-3-deoxy-D-gluconate 5-dehydrogenase
MSTDRFSLAGSTALVTGSRSGIGAAIAVGLAGAGADLILHGHGDEPDRTAAAVRAAGRAARPWILDLAEPATVPDACAELLAETRVDILVNNAGIIHRASALDATYRDWRAVLSVNLDAAFVLTQCVGREMVRRRQGKVITIASLLSFQGGINVVSYTASKHAVAGMTRALANEWAADNVQVNAIAPGYIETANTEALRVDPVRERAIRERIPAGRWGTPDDLVGAAVFLASRASDYVTGHILAVDGGWLAR